MPNRPRLQFVRVFVGGIKITVTALLGGVLGFFVGGMLSGVMLSVYVSLFDPVCLWTCPDNLWVDLIMWVLFVAGTYGGVWYTGTLALRGWGSPTS